MGLFNGGWFPCFFVLCLGVAFFGNNIRNLELKKRKKYNQNLKLVQTLRWIFIQVEREEFLE